MMFVAMFQSDKKCGPDLWAFGIVMLVVGMTHSFTRAKVHTYTRELARVPVRAYVHTHTHMRKHNRAHTQAYSINPLPLPKHHHHIVSGIFQACGGQSVSRRESEQAKMQREQQELQHMM